MISIVVATARGNVIGKANDLPWYLPADLKHFKQLTEGHTVVMGRKTFESIMARLGKPLPNRRNIVITRDPDYKAPGARVVYSLEAALREQKADDQLFVIGGAQIYEQALSLVERVYLTQVEADIQGDAFLPELAASQWQEVSSEPHQADERNPHNYSFKVFDRVAPPTS